MSQTAILLGLKPYTPPNGVLRTVIFSDYQKLTPQEPRAVRGLPAVKPVHNMVLSAHRKAAAVIDAIRIGCRTINDIVEYTGIGRGTVFQVVRALVKIGQVERDNSMPRNHYLPDWML